MGAEFNDLREFQKKLNTEAGGFQKFAEECTRDMAGRLLSYVIPDTPVGKDRTVKGFQGDRSVVLGGTLRRGWVSITHQSAFGDAQSLGGPPNAKEQKNSIKEKPITVSGNTYTIDIINPVEYALYVEYGHRTRGGGFVQGQLMLKHSCDKLRPQMNKILGAKIRRKFKDLM